MPERHIHKADPSGRHCLKTNDCCGVSNPAHKTCYRSQCFNTAEAFVKRARVSEYSVAFQSRLGKEPWLKPYSDKVIEDLARNGVKKLLVICPSFVCDCLETLEEMGMRGRESFLNAGGVEFTLIPCLNRSSALAGGVEKYDMEFLSARRRAIGENRCANTGLDIRCP